MSPYFTRLQLSLKILQRLVECFASLRMVEVLESEYLAFSPERKVHPNVIRGDLASIEGKMRIPVHQEQGGRDIREILTFHCTHGARSSFIHGNKKRVNLGWLTP